MTMWPNVERAIVAHLATAAPTYTQTAGTMPDRYVIVEQVGGSGGRVDQALSIEVTVSSRISRGDMWDLASHVETMMRGLAASQAAGVYIDNVDIPFGFGIDMPATQGVWRANATFSLTVRPHNP